MNILLLGYGKMGKAIERLALARGHEIAGRITSTNRDDLNTVTADVAIEFSQPEAAFENVQFCLQRQLPVVCGTTGWLARKPELEKLAVDCNGTFFYASNFSVGVNVFFRLNEYLASMMSQQGYTVHIDEIHHTEKKDAPSGTAISLAEGIMKHLTYLKKWVNKDSDRPDELSISSFRIDQVPGTHLIKYSSANDDIEIRHIAHTRDAFAAGALMVAEWLPGKTGVLTMKDFLQF